MTADPYVYPGTNILRNKLGIRDAGQLDSLERECAIERAAQGIPKGMFDLHHLKKIHYHLFQDVYEWAGEIRTVEISKDGHQFQFCRFIETGMANVHSRLVRANYLQRLPAPDFAQQAGQIIGDVNYVHPFREGNGRTQLQYLKLLAERAGHAFDLTRLDILGEKAWVQASREAHQGRYDAMARCIEGMITGRVRAQESRQSLTDSLRRSRDDGERER